MSDYRPAKIAVFNIFDKLACKHQANMLANRIYASVMLASRLEQ